MQLQIRYTNFMYSPLLTSFVFDLIADKLEIELQSDQELVEIFFFRPTSIKKDGRIYFECHLEAEGTRLTERISAQCEEENFWKCLRKTTLLLIKQINNEAGIYCPTVFPPNYYYGYSAG